MNLQEALDKSYKDLESKIIQIYNEIEVFNEPFYIHPDFFSSFILYNISASSISEFRDKKDRNYINDFMNNVFSEDKKYMFGHEIILDDALGKREIKYNNKIY
jgi:hypothetical protein